MGKQWKQWQTLFWWAADGDCSHEIKRCLLLGRKAMTNIDSILKSRHITLPTKVYLVKAMVFPVVMYGHESWSIKKGERLRIDAFNLWCWRRLLRVPWTVRRSNQSILKEISPEYSLERLMLKLKLQYFGHLMGRTDSLEKTLMLGKIEGRRRRGGQMASETWWTWIWASSRSWWWMGRCVVVHGVAKSQTWLSNWIELMVGQDWVNNTLSHIANNHTYIQKHTHMHTHHILIEWKTWTICIQLKGAVNSLRSHR